jgi:hypothetical protein
LNGLILATPISDIVQSIGRIDRIKHCNIVPLIVDIVDKFSIYENQARKRFTLFKKKKYQIEDIHYDIDRMHKGISKNYFFHNIKDTEKSDTESEFSNEENTMNLSKQSGDEKNTKIKNKTNKPIKIDKDMSGKDIDELFKQYAFS